MTLIPRSLSAVSLLIAVLLISGCGRKLDPRAQEVYDLVLMGKIDDAIALSNSILVDEPENYQIRNVLGTALYKSGDVEASIEQYRRALETDPEYAEAHFNLGNSLQALERIEEAEAEFALAIRHQRDFVLAHFNLGKIYQESGRVDQALAEYRRAVDYDPQFLYGFIDLGNLLYESADFEGAVTNLGRALELEPGIKEVRLQLGNAYMQSGTQGHLELAEAEFRAAVGIDGDYAEAAYSLGVALVTQNRTDEAVEWFERVLELTNGEEAIAQKVRDYFEHIGYEREEEPTAG